MTVAQTKDRPADELRPTRATPVRGVVARGTAQITSLTPPSFADPVSQPCTTAQLQEPAFAEWRRVLGRADATWPAAFILQVFDRYGALLPGARGGRFGDDAPEVARVLADRGAASDGPDLDFAWAICATLDPPELLPLARTMLATLRAGALGAIVFPFGPDALRRTDVERATLALIADDHAVAALKFRGELAAATVPFGFVFGRSSRS